MFYAFNKMKKLSAHSKLAKSRNKRFNCSLLFVAIKTTAIITSLRKR